MQKKFPKRFLICTLPVAALIIAAYYLYNVYDYLSITRQVQPDVLVIEGWLDNNALDCARDEFLQHNYNFIITNGFPNDGAAMGSGGKLTIDPEGRLMASNNNLYKITLILRGTKAKKEYAHFKVYADTLEIGNGYSSKQKKPYTYNFKSTQTPDSIMIVFDNDTYNLFNDRNLVFYSMEINKQVFHPGNSKITYYKRRHGLYWFERQKTADKAHDAASYLIASGVPDSLVFAVPTNHKLKSKTYTTALDVKEYITNHHTGLSPDITVLTVGVHARRSWVSYKKAFGNSAKIGVIAVPDKDLTRTTWRKKYKGWRKILYETAGVFYAWLVL